MEWLVKYFKYVLIISKLADPQNSNDWENTSLFRVRTALTF